MRLEDARKIAVDICTRLQPYCEKIHIAGSIRRKKPEVKDIEICLLPNLGFTESGDLFGNSIRKIEINPIFKEIVNTLGIIEKGNVNGKYMKIVLPQGINLDLFMPEQDDYFRQLIVRTGSSEYSHKIIANGWRKIGWVGSDIGLRLEKDCIEHKDKNNKSKWVCVRNKNNKPPIWTSEKSVYEWLKIPYLDPELRNI